MSARSALPLSTDGACLNVEAESKRFHKIGPLLQGTYLFGVLGRLYAWLNTEWSGLHNNNATDPYFHALSLNVHANLKTQDLGQRRIDIDPVMF